MALQCSASLGMHRTRKTEDVLADELAMLASKAVMPAHKRSGVREMRLHVMRNPASID